MAEEKAETKKTLKDFGYFFDHTNCLKSVSDPSKGFQFTTQTDYQEVGEAVIEEIHQRLLDLGLEAKRSKELGGVVFVSPELEKYERVLVMICG